MEEFIEKKAILNLAEIQEIANDKYGATHYLIFKGTHKDNDIRVIIGVDDVFPTPKIAFYSEAKSLTKFEKDVFRLADALRKAAGCEFISVKRAAEITGMCLTCIKIAIRNKEIKYFQYVDSPNSKMMLHVLALAEWIEAHSHPAQR